jgi:hypothetical protein
VRAKIRDRTLYEQRKDFDLQEVFVWVLDLLPPPLNRNPGAIMIARRLSHVNEEPVYLTVDDQVVKFYFNGQRQELLWGRSVPNGLPMEAGVVDSSDKYSFRGEQLAPANHLYSQMPRCIVL